MEIPNYVLKANERVLTPKSKTFGQKMFSYFVWTIVFILVIGSIIFGENLFFELSGLTLSILFSLVVDVFLAGGSEKTASPFEIQFYDDYLIIYREKKYFGKNDYKKEIRKLFYKDITECVHRTKVNKLVFWGAVEITRYNYKKDGSLSNKPDFHKILKKDGVAYFYTDIEPNVNFVEEIEKHSPLKVDEEYS